MPKRYTVEPGTADRPAEFIYPADPVSLKLVRDAGGLSKMTDENRERVKFKTVRAGDDCSDMPEPALSLYLQRGWISAVNEKRKPVVVEEKVT